MFSDEGNAFVAELVRVAKVQKLNWDELCAIMQALSDEYEYLAEMMDTAVREEVWVEMGF